MIDLSKQLVSVAPEFAAGYMSADMSQLVDFNGTVIGSARVVNTWAIRAGIVSDAMYQVECIIDGFAYTGRTAGAMMLWRGKIVRDRKPSGFQLVARPDANPKTAKGMRRGVMTFVMHFAPADLSGFEVCSNRSDACTVLCLNTAGRGRFDATQAARIRKAQWYFNDRPAFMAALHDDIRKAARYAGRRGFDCAVRLNGTSDIPWHRVPVAGAASIMECYPEIQFYDYTKVSGRLLRHDLPRNYHLTFSLSEDNDETAAEVLRRGGSVAAVFRNRATVERLLAIGSYTVAGFTVPVVDGDETDLRYLDPAGSLVALYAKGMLAKRDRSGFVRDM